MKTLIVNAGAQDDAHATNTWEELGQKAVQVAKEAVGSNTTTGNQGDGDGLLDTATWLHPPWAPQFQRQIPVGCGSCEAILGVDGLAGPSLGVLFTV